MAWSRGKNLTPHKKGMRPNHPLMSHRSRKHSCAATPPLRRMAEDGTNLNMPFQPPQFRQSLGILRALQRGGCPGWHLRLDTTTPVDHSPSLWQAVVAGCLKVAPQVVVC